MPREPEPVPAPDPEREREPEPENLKPEIGNLKSRRDVKLQMADGRGTGTIAGDIPVRVALAIAAVLGLVAGGWNDPLMVVELWLLCGALTWSLAFEPQRPERLAAGGAK